MDDSQAEAQTAAQAGPAPEPAAHAASEGPAKEAEKPKVRGFSIGKAEMPKIEKEYARYGLYYLLIALLLFYPVTFSLASKIYGIGADAYQNLWEIWWVNFALFNLHSSFYTTSYVFAPIGANLISQTMPPIFALLSFPFQAISIPFAYNVVFFLGFALSGLAACALADYLTGDRKAAFLAGIIFAFSAFHMAQSMHIEWIQLEWIPLAALFFIKMARGERRLRNSVFLALSVLLTVFMGGIEQLILLSLLLLSILLAFAVHAPSRRGVLDLDFARHLVLSVVIVLALGSWSFIPILQYISSPSNLKSINALNVQGYNQLWSSDLLSFFLPSSYNNFFSGLAYSAYPNVVGTDPIESSTYIGYVAIALSLMAVWAAWRKEAHVRFWAIAAIAFMLLALGPRIYANGSPLGLPGPYYLFHMLPFISVLREPGRFDMLVSLAFAMLTAFGARELFARAEGAKGPTGAMAFIKENRKAVFAAIAILYLVESAGISLSAGFTFNTTVDVSVPQIYHQLAGFTDNFSILMLPAQPSNITQALAPALNMYYAAVAEKPLVGGYLTRENSTQNLSVNNIPLAVQAQDLQDNGMFRYLPTPVRQNLTNQSLLTMYNYDVAIVTVNKRAYNGSAMTAFEQYMQAVFGNSIYQDETTVVYQTHSAYNRSVFYSYVAYPQFGTWGQASGLVNGTNRVLWLPKSSAGIVIAYAPFANATQKADNMTNGAAPVYDNTTILVGAVSAVPGSILYVKEKVNGSDVTIGTANLTRKLGTYAVPARLLAGPQGNILEFQIYLPTNATVQAGDAIGITGISFSRAG